MAPPHVHPAARDDLLAVYQALLSEYAPEQIGMYGCSAGAIIIAQAITTLKQQAIPQPAAVGMICGAPHHWHQGDANSFVAAIQNAPTPGPAEFAYFKGQDCDDPSAFPGQSPELMAQFPSSLLVSSTRDFFMSSVVVTHAQLVQMGGDAELHIFEGLEHAFIYNPELGESRDAYGIMVRFFNKQLGKSVTA